MIESGPNELPGGSVDAGNGQQFAFSVRGCTDDTLVGRVKTEVLPALGATRIQPTDPID